MNSTFCPQFRAMDQLFVDSDSCDVALPGYVVWLSILTLSKIVIAVGVSIDWQRQYLRRNVQQTQMKKTKFWERRLPVVPAVISSTAVAQTTFLVVTSLGVCNSHNGCGLAMYAVMYTFFASYSLLLLRRFIKLGRKVIPLANAKLIEDRVINSGVGGLQSSLKAGGGPIQEKDTYDGLAHMDTALKVTVWLQVTFIILQLVSGTFLELLIPHQDFPQRFLQITFGLQAGCFYSNMLGSGLQLNRLIKATSMGCTKPYPAVVRVALRKMRRLQVGFLSCHLIADTFTLMIGVGVVPPYWYIILLLMSVDSSAAVLAFLVLVVRRKKSNSSEKLDQIGVVAN